MRPPAASAVYGAKRLQVSTCIFNLDTRLKNVQLCTISNGVEKYRKNNPPQKSHGGGQSWSFFIEFLGNDECQFPGKWGTQHHAAVFGIT